MGNGLLTFVDKKTELDDMFNNKEIVMYENINDLTEKKLIIIKSKLKKFVIKPNRSGSSFGIKIIKNQN